MATFVKFNKFLLQLGQEKYDFTNDVLKFALTNTAPTPATDTVWSTDVFPAPAAANGYTAGGHTATKTWTESGGVATLGCTTDVVLTATAGGIGPFRYVILYDDSAPSKELIGYWDYGASVTVAVGETFTIDVTDSLLTIT